MFALMLLVCALFGFVVLVVIAALEVTCGCVLAVFWLVFGCGFGFVSCCCLVVVGRV